MKSFHSGISRTFCLMFGLIVFFSLATSASSPAPPRAPELPKEISGHFTYVEYAKVDNANDGMEEGATLIVNIDSLTFVSLDQFEMQAVYYIAAADFSAKGELKSWNNSTGCKFNSVETYSGGGAILHRKQFPLIVQENPNLFIWFIKENRFSLHFQTTERSVQVKMTDTYCQPTKTVVNTDKIDWEVDLEGKVDYDAGTKTYDFVLLESYKRPFTEALANFGAGYGPDLKTNVHVQGDITGKVK